MLLTQLSSELGISARTVWRDPGVLQTAGFSLDEQLGERGVKAWRMPSPRPQLQVGYADLISVMISRQFKSRPRHRTPASNPFRPRFFFRSALSPEKRVALFRFLATTCDQPRTGSCASGHKQLRTQQDQHERCSFNRAAGETRQVPGETGQLRPLNSSRRSR